MPDLGVFTAHKLCEGLGKRVSKYAQEDKGSSSQLIAALRSNDLKVQRKAIKDIQLLFRKNKEDRILLPLVLIKGMTILLEKSDFEIKFRLLSLFVEISESMPYVFEEALPVIRRIAQEEKDASLKELAEKVLSNFEIQKKRDAVREKNSVESKKGQEERLVELKMKVWEKRGILEKEEKAKELREESPLTFWDVCSLSVDLSFVFPYADSRSYGGEIPSSYGNKLPIFDQNKKPEKRSYDSFFFDAQLKLYLYSVLGLGVGFGKGVDTVWASSEDENGYVSADQAKGKTEVGSWNFIGPIAELRLPIFSFGEKNVQFALFGTYIMHWPGESKLVVKRGLPDESELENEVTVATFERRHTVDFGTQLLFGEIFGVKVFGRYSPAEIKESKVSGDPSFDLNEWFIGFSVDAFIFQGDKKSIFNW